jgi:uncharacterized protein involved in propanediol utilization
MQILAPAPDTRAAPPDRARPAPAAVLFPHRATPRRAGQHAIHAHHGEIVQGMFYSADGRVEHGLVTLPCPLFGTRARFRPMRSAPLTVEPGGRAKAKTAARLTMDALGRAGWGGSLRVEGNVPLAWGCGSSTTDVLATIGAVADAFDAVLEPEWIARLATAAETASDSLMFGPGRAVLFAQRRGSLLQDLGGPLPEIRVLGFNTEGGHGVETLTLPPIDYSWREVESFQPILGLLRRAVEEQDAGLLGRVASASAEINQRHRPKRNLPQVFRLAKCVGAVGVQVAHSGTVAGLLFHPRDDAPRRIAHARAGLARLGVTAAWEFSPDPTDPPEVFS